MRGEERRGGGCTLEEAVVVGRQWEKTETVGLRKGEGTEEESCEGRIERGRGGRETEQNQRDGRSGSQEPYKELRAYS